MYISQTKLPHLLRPDDYYSDQSHQRDLDLLRRTWHLVGTTAELKSAGDFLTTEIAGTPVQIRNFKGQIRALSNVCTHRHSIICSKPCGNSSAMRCQYHGWEFQEDGSTGKIPEPKNFVPFERDSLQLDTFRVACAGQLVFVTLDSDAPSLREFLGDEFYHLLNVRFSDRYHLSLKWDTEYPANWKIPIENSLESYHIPAVHPQSFKVDPGSERSEHRLHDNRTSFHTALPFSPHSWLDACFQRLEGTMVRFLGVRRNDTYEQHHVFPNLLFSFTDAISLCQCIQPRTPKSSRTIVRQFGRLAEDLGWRDVPARWWSRLKAAVTKHILHEDLGMFEPIQQGLQASRREGVLGICEERIHRFQQYIVKGRKDD